MDEMSNAYCNRVHVTIHVTIQLNKTLELKLNVHSQYLYIQTLAATSPHKASSNAMLYSIESLFRKPMNAKIRLARLYHLALTPTVLG